VSAREQLFQGLQIVDCRKSPGSGC
jgi:hypothetical protein